LTVEQKYKKGFTYDGQAPAAYFWIDTNSVPSTNGRRLLDATPTNGCGKQALPIRATGQTYIVEFPPGITIRNYLGGCKCASMKLFILFDNFCTHQI
jgi:hypothetical protein